MTLSDSPTQHDTQVAQSRPVGPKVAMLAVGVAILGLFYYFDLGAWLTLANVKAHRDDLLRAAEQHLVATAIAYVGVYATVTGFSLPGAAILTLAGGFMFGALLGAALANIGATIGATGAFALSRYVLRDWVERTFGDRVASLQAGFSRDAFTYLLTLRLVPLFPFFLVNLVAGLTRIPLMTYVVATSLGIIPGGLVYAFAGRQLGSIDSLADVASPGVLFAFSLLGLLALVPVAYRKWTEARG
ncbi:MAG: TVP38/TMEM64 family protein [Nitrospiraceae bacterium]